MSAASRPAAGPMPKPWPLKPAETMQARQLVDGGDHRDPVRREVDQAAVLVHDLHVGELGIDLGDALQCEADQLLLGWRIVVRMRSNGETASLRQFRIASGPSKKERPTRIVTSL